LEFGSPVFAIGCTVGAIGCTVEVTGCTVEAIGDTVEATGGTVGAIGDTVEATGGTVGAIGGTALEKCGEVRQNIFTIKTCHYRALINTYYNFICFSSSFFKNNCIFVIKPR